MNSEPLVTPDVPVRDGPTAAARRDWRTPVRLVVLAALAVAAWRILPHKSAGGPVEVSRLPVAVVKVGRENLSRELVTQAEFRPYQEIEIHSKISGFLDDIRVDIGDRVEAGQVIATLDVPELQDDLKRARAVEQRSADEVRRAEAGYDEAHFAYTRLAAANEAQPRLFSPQDLDAAKARDQQAASALAAARQQVEVAKAETSKLNTMVQYSHITASFAGVITRRYADPGALIPAGTSSGSQTMPLVRLSQLDRLRLVFPVSMSYVSQVGVGSPAEIRVPGLERVLTGKVARITRKIETATRTMDVEMDVPNPDLKLIPGMYASVVLQLDHRDQALALPVQAVMRDKRSTVLVVNSRHELEERTVKVGVETPTKVEILDGLHENELVMIGSRSRVKPGQLVEPKLPGPDKE